MHTVIGEAGCGLIYITTGMKVVIRAKLPRVDPKGATTAAEHLLVALGFKLLLETGFRKERIVVVNDNTKMIQMVNSEESFKEVVGEHGWSKHKV